jgi:RNA polymerase sigma-70 factor (ECF subfamily)
MATSDMAEGMLATAIPWFFGLAVFSKSKPAGSLTSERVLAPAPIPAAGGGGPIDLPNFATIYDQHFAFVWRLAAMSRVPASHLDDVVQETFLVIHRRLPSFEGRSSLRTWIAAVTRNTAHEFVRRKRHQLLGSELDPDASASAALTPAEQLEATAAAQLLDQFLAELPDDQREIFVLAEVEQMTAIEIGSILDINPNTVRTKLRAARMSVQASLARHRAAERWREP